MAGSLSDLLSWAEYVEQGIRLLELSVERKDVQEDEVGPNEAMQKFKHIIDEARTLKISAQNAVEKLKTMSGELKDLINTAESEEIMKIDQELRTMLNTLFPIEVTVEESFLVAVSETEQINVDDGNLLGPPLAEAAPISPAPSQQSHPEESFAEVEITPGLIKKVPKSSVETGDLIPSSHRFVDNFLRPIRKKTLVFSPDAIPRPERSPIPETSTPQVALPADLTNFDSARAKAGPNAHNCEITSEDTTDSPEILQRPTRPVLTAARTLSNLVM